MDAVSVFSRPPPVPVQAGAWHGHTSVPSSASGSSPRQSSASPSASPAAPDFHHVLASNGTFVPSDQIIAYEYLLSCDAALPSPGAVSPPCSILRKASVSSNPSPSQRQYPVLQEHLRPAPPMSKRLYSYDCSVPSSDTPSPRALQKMIATASSPAHDRQFPTFFACASCNFMYTPNKSAGSVLGLQSTRNNHFNMRHDDCMVIPVNTSDCFDFENCADVGSLDFASCLLPPPMPSSTALAQMLLSPDTTSGNDSSSSSSSSNNSQMFRASDGALVPVHQLGIYECMLVLRAQDRQTYAAAARTPEMSPSSSSMSSGEGFSGCSSPLALVNGICASPPAGQLFFDNLFFPSATSLAAATADAAPAAVTLARRSSTSLVSRKSSSSPVPPSTAAAAGSGRVAECVNCSTRETSVWRKDELGRTICNACGLYKKQRGYDRPAVFPFRKNVVRKRARQPTGSSRKSKQQAQKVENVSTELNSISSADIDGFTNLFSI
ncbi:Erythroid transcription factor [Entophlyctis sp. JEL0112]|nr:Erythroid transcription factor [Entophlyctis sp. JEL0112]